MDYSRKTHVDALMILVLISALLPLGCGSSGHSGNSEWSVGSSQKAVHVVMGCDEARQEEIRCYVEDMGVSHMTALALYLKAHCVNSESSPEHNVAMIVPFVIRADGKVFRLHVDNPRAARRQNWVTQFSMNATSVADAGDDPHQVAVVRDTEGGRSTVTGYQIFGAGSHVMDERKSYIADKDGRTSVVCEGQTTKRTMRWNQSFLDSLFARVGGWSPTRPATEASDQEPNEDTAASTLRKKLEDLDRLRSEGVLTREEYDRKRSALIDHF